MKMLVNEDLIAAVYARRCLWDQRNKHYHNRHVVDQNWNEIGKELKQDAVCMKKKWKQLRDTFRSELKKILPERSGDSGPDGVSEIYSQWSHFKSMMFLKDQMKCRKSSAYSSQQFKSIEKNNYIDDEDNNSSIDMEVSKTSQNEENEATYCRESDSRTFEVETSTSQNPRKNLKRHHDDMKAELINIEKKKLELMGQKLKNQIQSDDEDMAFFVSLLPHVRKMDPETKLLCRMEMQTSVLNHAYKNGRPFIQNVQNQDRCVSTPSPIPVESLNCLTTSPNLSVRTSLTTGINKEDSDYNFLVSILPNMKSVSDVANLQFRIEVNTMLLNIKKSEQNIQSENSSTGSNAVYSNLNSTNRLQLEDSVLRFDDEDLNQDTYVVKLEDA